jgi:benzoate-CoA ligase family protein
MGSNVESTPLLPEQLNVASYFLDENISQGRGERVAIYYKNKSYTYNDIVNLTNRVGNVLKELSVEIENRVYMVLNDSPEYVATYYGTMKIGAQIAPSYTMLPAATYGREINIARAKVVVTDSTHIDVLREATKGSKYPKAFLVLGTSPSNLRKGEYDFYSMVGDADEKLEAEPTHGDDSALFGFSGGTTGQGKALCARHRHMVFAYESFQQIMHYTKDDVVLSIPKMSFGYGRTGTIMFPFREGAAGVLFPERTTTEKIFELVEQYRPTILIQVPTMMRKMLETPKEKRSDLSCVRLCTCAAETLSAELYFEWRRNFGCEVIDCLGSAEMFYNFICNRPGEVVPGSVGKPMPGYEAKIVDDEGRELPDGEVGVLTVKGGSSFSEYYHDPERTRDAVRGEWIYTRDLLRRDKEGNFWFAGRKDQLLKVSGYFVSPLEIEKCIETHPDVLECAVVVVKDADGVNKTKAFVVLKDSVTPSQLAPDEIKKYTKERLSHYASPKFVELVSKLPRTRTGKIDRAQLT